MTALYWARLAFLIVLVAVAASLTVFAFRERK